MLTLRLRYAFFRFGNAVRTQNRKRHAKSASASVDSINYFTIQNEEGKDVHCDILFTFDGDSNKHYVVYTDHSLDDDGNINTFASIVSSEGDYRTLSPIETDEEWKLVERTMEYVEKAVKNGESTDADFHCEGTDDEALEPLSYVLFTKIDEWSDRFHFPVGILPFYTIGLILIHSIDAKPTPLWADIGLTVLELAVMRIAHNPYDWFPSLSAYIITLYLYLVWLACVLDRLSPCMKSSYIVTGFWFTRVMAIVTALLGLLWQRHKERKSRNK